MAPFLQITSFLLIIISSLFLFRKKSTIALYILASAFGVEIIRGLALGYETPLIAINLAGMMVLILFATRGEQTNRT